MQKTWLKFDNSSKVKSISKLLQIMVIMALMDVRLSGFAINDQNFQSVVDMDYEDSSRYINFSEGSWYIIKNSKRNPDGRILEFHSAQQGFINYYNSFYMSGQSFLYYPSRILAFYSTKEPLITESIIDNTKVLHSTLDQVFELLQGLYDSNSSILDNFNKFPYMSVNAMDQKRSNILDDFYKELRLSLDPERSAALIKKYYIPLSQPNLAEFMKEVVSLLIDTSMVNSLDVLRNQNYQNTNQEVLDQQKEAKSKLLSEEFENILQHEKENQLFSVLYSQIEYFAHKTLRAYFLHRNHGFLNDLFANFNPDSSTLDSQFSNLNSNFPTQNVINSLGILRNHFDFPFDYYPRIIQIESDLDEPESLKKYIHDRIDKLTRTFDGIIQMLRSLFSDKLNMEIFDSIDYTDWHYLMSLFNAFSKVFYRDLFIKYSNLVQEEMKNMKSIKDDGLYDLNVPGNLAILRRDLSIIGVINVNESIDRANLFYIYFEIFKKTGRRLLI